MDPFTGELFAQPQFKNSSCLTPRHPITELQVDVCKSFEKYNFEAATKASPFACFEYEILVRISVRIKISPPPPGISTALPSIVPICRMGTENNTKFEELKNFTLINNKTIYGLDVSGLSEKIYYNGNIICFKTFI